MIFDSAEDGGWHKDSVGADDIQSLESATPLVSSQEVLLQALSKALVPTMKDTSSGEWYDGGVVVGI